MNGSPDRGSVPATPAPGARRLLVWLVLALLVGGALAAYVWWSRPSEQRCEAARKAIDALGCKATLSAGELDIEAGTDFDDEKLAKLAGHARDCDSVLLKLKGSRVSGKGLESLKKLTNLRQLDLSGLSLTDDSLAALSGLDRLEQLDLSRTGIGDDGLRHLKSLKALRRLFLDGNPKVTSAGLAHLLGLSELRDLRLRGTRVDDAGLRKLAELKQLEKLWLKDVPGVTEAGIDELKKALPELSVKR